MKKLCIPLDSSHSVPNSYPSSQIYELFRRRLILMENRLWHGFLTTSIKYISFFVKARSLRSLFLLTFFFSRL